jgi:ParB-like chromosome segregation protein Spo0J
MGKLKAPGKPGFNAGENLYAKTMRVSDIVIIPEIANIFQIDERIKNEIKEKIKLYGYDKNQPVVVWKDKNILVDGRTRYTAAIEAGKDEIPVTEKEFNGLEEAIMYTFERQVVRRNLSSPEIMKVVEMLPNERGQYGAGREADKLAKRLHTSTSMVYKAKEILKAVETAPEGDDVPAKILEEVKSGEKSIKKGSDELRNRRRPKPEKKFYVTDAHGLPDNVSFLKAAVILLVESGHRAPSEILINHFLKKNEKCGFYDILPDNIKAQLPKLPLIGNSVPVQ